MSHSHQRDLGMAIAMLIEAFNVKEMTPVRVKIYERGLMDIPQALLEPTVMRAIKTRTAKVKDWLPSIDELLADAEAVRVEMRAALVFAPCEQCSASGWTEKEIDGVKRMTRCACWQAHQARVAALQVGTTPLSLPASRESDFSQVSES